MFPKEAIEKAKQLLRRRKDQYNTDYEDIKKTIIISLHGITPYYTVVRHNTVQSPVAITSS